MKRLRNKLIRVTYERLPGKDGTPPTLHHLVGRVKSIRKSSVVIEQEGEPRPLGFRNIRGYTVLDLKDVNMRRRIESMVGDSVTIEFDTGSNLIRTTGMIRAIFLHHFDFESDFEEDKLYRVHYDQVIQVDLTQNVREKDYISIITDEKKKDNE